MFRTFRALLVLIPALTLSVERTKADVIFNNFGPNHSFSIFGYGFGGVPTEIMRAYTAAAFTVPTDQSFRLDDFTIAVDFNIPGEPPSPEPFDIFLLSSAPNGMLDRIIESFSETVTAPVPPTLFTINSALHPILLSGNQYWIAVTAGSGINSSIDGAWKMNVIEDVGPVAQGADLSSLIPFNSLRPAFEVEGTRVAAVPEPSSWLLLGAGMLALCLVRRSWGLRLL
jgi:PEP-CTERM motif